MRQTCLNLIYELAKKDNRIFFIGSDLGKGTLKKFKEEMPERFFMEGVNEANIIGMAAGLALEGKIVYFNTIATFISRRCFEQTVLDLCLHKANVRIIGSGGGFVYAPLGPTHDAIEDIAIMRSIPNMTIVAPADADEMKRLMPLTVDYQGPIYIRLAKGGDPIVTSDKVPFEIGKAILIREGLNVLIITTGITLKIALDASSTLEKEGIEAGILHVPTIKPLDKESVIKCVSNVQAVITIEEHTVIGGLGSAIAEVIAETHFNSIKRFKRIGIPDVFPEGYGSQASLMEKYNITTEHLLTEIKNLIKRK